MRQSRSKSLFAPSQRFTTIRIIRSDNIYPHSRRTLHLSDSLRRPRWIGTIRSAVYHVDTRDGIFTSWTQCFILDLWVSTARILVSWHCQLSRPSATYTTWYANPILERNVIYLSRTGILRHEVFLLSSVPIHNYITGTRVRVHTCSLWNRLRVHRKV